MTATDRRLISLIFLSVGVLLNFGDISAGALLCVVISAALAMHSCLARAWGPPLPRPVRIALLVTLSLTALLYTKRLPHAVFPVTCAALALAVITFSLTRRPAVRWTAALVAATASVTGVVSNMVWGVADIDVFQFQQTASHALIGGQNPYLPLVPSQNVTSPNIISVIALHFPYGPVVAILEAPFRLLGDVRMLHVLAAIITTAAVLVLARRAGTIDLTAPLVMAFPLMVGMILFSWVDIITMAGFATWLVLFRSHPRLATIALAVALGAKPTTLIALVPIFFWSARARPQVVVATMLAALLALPFAAVTGFSQFYYDVVGVQLAVLPRLDSLTINSLLHSFDLPLLPFGVSAAIVAVTTLVVLRHRPSTYGDLLAGTAAIVTVSFLVAKWAYFNYYYIAAVMLMMAIAGGALELDAPEMIHPPLSVLRVVDLVRVGARQRWRNRPIRETVS